MRGGSFATISVRRSAARPPITSPIARSSMNSTMATGAQRTERCPIGCPATTGVRAATSRGLPTSSANQALPWRGPRGSRSSMPTTISRRSDTPGSAATRHRSTRHRRLPPRSSRPTRPRPARDRGGSRCWSRTLPRTAACISVGRTSRCSAVTRSRPRCAGSPTRPPRFAGCNWPASAGRARAGWRWSCAGSGRSRTAGGPGSWGAMRSPTPRARRRPGSPTGRRCWSSTMSWGVRIRSAR